MFLDCFPMRALPFVESRGISVQTRTHIVDQERELRFQGGRQLGACDRGQRHQMCSFTWSLERTAAIRALISSLFTCTNCSGLFGRSAVPSTLAPGRAAGLFRLWNQCPHCIFRWGREIQPLMEDAQLAICGESGQIGEHHGATGVIDGGDQRWERLGNEPFEAIAVCGGTGIGSKDGLPS